MNIIPVQGKIGHKKDRIEVKSEFIVLRNIHALKFSLSSCIPGHFQLALTTCVSFKPSIPSSYHYFGAN